MSTIKNAIKISMIIFLILFSYRYSTAHADALLVYIVNADGDVVIASTNKGVYVWTIGDSINTIVLPELDVFAMALNPSGELLAIANQDNSISIWNIRSSEKLTYATGYQYQISALAWSSDGDNLFFMSQFEGLTVLNASTLTQIAYVPGGGNSLDVSPDGKSVAIGDFAIRIVRLEDKHIMTIDSGRGELRDVSWSHDGKYIASTGVDGILKVWDVSQQNEVFSFMVSPNTGTRVEFNPQSNLLATRDENSIIIINFDTGQIVQTISIGKGAFTWSKDGTEIIYIDLAQELPIFVPLLPDLLPTATLIPLPTHTYTPSPTFTFIPTPDPCAYHPATSAELVSAITSANGTPQADTICLTSSATYTFNAAHHTLTALPAVTTEINLVGNGATLSREAGAPNFRFWEVLSGGNLTLNNVTLTNGNTTGNQGGALLNNSGTVTLNSTTFTNNASNTGGAIDSTAGTVTITAGIFANNTAQYGGAIDNDAASTMSITNTTFTTNTSTYDGGALHNDGGNLTLTNSQLTSNTANRYGGGVDNDGTLTISGSTFSLNTALKRGGGINNVGSLTMNGNSQLLSNVAGTGEGWGGGLMNQSNATASLTDVLIQGNSANQHGGGIRNHASLTLTNVTIEGNTANQNGGGVFNVSAGNISLIGGSIRQNQATGDGGGLYNSSSNSVITIQNSRLEGNTSGNRGGFAYVVGSLTLTNSHLLNNTSTNQGGGVYISSTATVSASGSCIQGNSNTAIFKGSTPIQNWQGNWWGSASGAGSTITPNTINATNFLTSGCPLP